jgi:hypothetical protein
VRVIGAFGSGRGGKMYDDIVVVVPFRAVGVAFSAVVEAAYH